tara:strand:- start:3381 stop:3905 length:525 start_codon:yes stop_codon:yes gene_type:complete
MPLTATVSRDCNFIDIEVNYQSANSYPMVGLLEFSDVNGSSLGSMTVTIPSQYAGASTVMPTSSLSITNGLVNIEFLDSNNNVIYTYPVLIHCDIDCCLAKLTNELIDCACDCAKCASSLAKAQKIFLLIKSAEYALAQAQSANAGNISGYLLDAHNKYMKARQICDDSCGCNC